jgi:hypothetical protein
MGKLYGNSGKLITAFSIMLVTVGLLGIQAIATGYLFHYFFGCSYLLGIIIGFGVLVLYSAFGGIQAVAMTDVLQFVIFFITVFICQIVETTGNLNIQCTDNESNNFMLAFIYCFGPWVFIFLVMVITLIALPLIKKAFSDVLGYAFVRASMVNIFSKILYSGSEMKNQIERMTPGNEKQKLEDAAEAIMKIVGNNSVFVNQMEPHTFESMWDVLKPLMKPGNYTDERQHMFNLVVLRDIVGEFCWYLLTGLLVCSVVGYNVSAKGCKKSVTQIQQEFDSTVPPSNNKGPSFQYGAYNPTL